MPIALDLGQLMWWLYTQKSKKIKFINTFQIITFIAIFIYLLLNLGVYFNHQSQNFY